MTECDDAPGRISGRGAEALGQSSAPPGAPAFCGTSAHSRPQPYEELKALAKERGVPVSELLVLAKSNDPFFCGMPAQRRAGDWFAEQFAAGHFGRGVHLRRIHYFLVSVEARMPNGLPYLNTVECWAALAEASKAARYLGLVDVDAFDDRRNPPAEVFEVSCELAASGVSAALPDVPSDVGDMPELPSLYVYPPSVVQPYALEIWCEKSTMNDVLRPLCERMQATLVTGLGELSITACKLLVRRVVRDGRPIRVLYVSDFDPAGRSMPVAVARKIEFLAQRQGLDIGLVPVALNADQVRRFSLPRVPIKESELRRERFERIYGQGATELDALEALHPGQLRKILLAAAAPYRDESAGLRIRAHLQKLQAQAMDATASAHDQYAEQIEQARADWVAIGEQLLQWQEKHAPTWQAITAELRAVDIDTSTFPEPEAPGDAAPPLFSSLRDYEEQLAFYRAFREGTA